MEIWLSPPHFALTHGYLTAISRLSPGYPQQRHPPLQWDFFVVDASGFNFARQHEMFFGVFLVFYWAVFLCFFGDGFVLLGVPPPFFCALARILLGFFFRRWNEQNREFPLCKRTRARGPPRQVAERGANKPQTHTQRDASSTTILRSRVRRVPARASAPPRHEAREQRGAQ